MSEAAPVLSIYAVARSQIVFVSEPTSVTGASAHSRSRTTNDSTSDSTDNVGLTHWQTWVDNNYYHTIVVTAKIV